MREREREKEERKKESKREKERKGKTKSSCSSENLSNEIKSIMLVINFFYTFLICTKSIFD